MIPLLIRSTQVGKHANRWKFFDYIIYIRQVAEIILQIVALLYIV